MKYIGIDGCKAGWFSIGLDEDGIASFAILEHISELSAYLPAVELVLIDIPIGLRGEHTKERLCDKQARKVLNPKRNSSVFPSPSRCALECDSYKEASERNKECTGRGLTKQTFNILPKIREVDQFLRNEEWREKVHEMHPEICFWALNTKQPMNFNKKTNVGYEERIAILNNYYPGYRKIVDKAMQEYSNPRLMDT